MTKYNLLSYEQAVALTQLPNSPFIESKKVIDNYSISMFNYRLVQYSDFVSNGVDNREMRGLTFIFNEDGSLFKRYILLEKFFNLNQVPGSQYSDVKDLAIKYINNKEDGSISSFVKLPNGKVLGKSKMSFESDQAIGMNRIYNKNKDIKSFVDWTLGNDIVAIFEYVSATNRIVLNYKEEELILLRLRNNNTGEHLDINNYLDKLGTIKFAMFENDKTLDDLIALAHTIEDKEGWVVQFENDHLIKIKCQWYNALHGLLTNDLYRENILIGYILDDKIDDIIGQIPENDVDNHQRIEKIISVIKQTITDKSNEILQSYELYKAEDDGSDIAIVKKRYALKYHRLDPNFSYVMNIVNGKDVYDLAIDWVRDKTKRLNIAREFLSERDSSIFFKEDIEE